MSAFFPLLLTITFQNIYSVTDPPYYITVTVTAAVAIISTVVWLAPKVRFLLATHTCLNLLAPNSHICGSNPEYR